MEDNIKVKKKRSIWFWVLIVAVALGVIGAIAGSGDDKDKAKTDTTKAAAEATEAEAEQTETAAKLETKQETEPEPPTEQATEPEPTEAPVEEKDGYFVGETVEAKGVKITFLSCEESEGEEFFEPDEGKIFVMAEFEIENNSEDAITISSILSVNAYADGYATDIDLSAAVVAKDTLDGTVDPGKKLKGILGYQLDKGWKKLELIIKPFTLSKTEMKFVHEK